MRGEAKFNLREGVLALVYRALATVTIIKPPWRLGFRGKVLVTRPPRAEKEIVNIVQFIVTRLEPLAQMSFDAKSGPNANR
jgi:hypothetical protein